MDARVRAGDSSSPSAEPAPEGARYVQVIRPAAEGVRVRLTDGSTLHITQETCTRHALEVGGVIEPPAHAVLLAESQGREAQTRALGLLSRAQHTRKALALKLERRGFPKDVVQPLLDKLTHLGYLDDERAAASWVDRRMEGRPMGKAALLAGLARHGVPRETAERVVEARLPAAEEQQAARRCLLRLYPTESARAALAEPEERIRAMRRLLGRGFSRAAARSAVEGAALSEDT